MLKFYVFLFVNSETIHLSDLKQIESKKINQFGYNRLKNERDVSLNTNQPNLRRRSLSFTHLQSAAGEWPENQINGQIDGILIDFSDELSINSSTAQQIMTETHKSLHQIDSNEPTSEEPTYCNVPINSSQLSTEQTTKYYCPPCGSSNGSTHNEELFKPEDRYYSAVASNYDESQSHSIGSLPSTQKYVWNPEIATKTSAEENCVQKITSERKTQAFDWLESKFNEIRCTNSPKLSTSDDINPQNSPQNHFIESETKNIETNNQLSKEFLAELESKFIFNPINEASINDSNKFNPMPNPIPMIQPPPKYATTRRNNYGLTTNHSNGISSNTTFATVCLPNRPSPQFNTNTAHVKPFIVTLTAPSRETIYGIGVSHNSIPGASLPTNIEFPQSLVARLQNRVKSASKEECISVLYKNSMDAVAALKELQLTQLIKLGISTKYECEQALIASNYDLEVAASRLLDQMSVK